MRYEVWVTEKGYGRPVIDPRTFKSKEAAEYFAREYGLKKHVKKTRVVRRES